MLTCQGMKLSKGSREGGRFQPSSPEPQPHQEPPLHPIPPGPCWDPSVSSWRGRRDVLVPPAAPSPSRQQPMLQTCPCAVLGWGVISDRSSGQGPLPARK